MDGGQTVGRVGSTPQGGLLPQIRGSRSEGARAEVDERTPPGGQYRHCAFPAARAAFGGCVQDPPKGASVAALKKNFGKHQAHSRKDPQPQPSPHQPGHSTGSPGPQFSMAEAPTDPGKYDNSSEDGNTLNSSSKRKKGVCFESRLHTSRDPEAWATEPSGFYFTDSQGPPLLWGLVSPLDASSCHPAVSQVPLSDLEQKILQVLQEAGSPMKTAQLVKKCQVSKKELNQVLYRMKAVTCTGPATWCLGGDGTRDVVPSEPAEPGPSCSYRPSEEAAQKPLQNAATIPQSPGSSLGEQRQKAIYTLLAANGPRDALSIARALGMKTAKDVNPDLYAMRSKHLLSLDQNSKSWAVYRPEDSRRKNQFTENIYQQSRVNMFIQTGPSGTISITNSKGIQIGSANMMQKHTASGRSGSTAPPRPPPVAPDDPSMQEAPAGDWGPRDIHVVHCRQVQLGHHNIMTLHGPLDKSPVCTPLGSPPVSATPSPEASLEVQMPKRGPHSEGDEAEKVPIKACLLEDTAIKQPGPPAVAARIRRPSAEPMPGTADAGSARYDSDFPGNVGQADPGIITTLNSQMDTLTFGRGYSTPAENRAPWEGN
ncbi:Z-DNA-binding protein 1 [Dugong dugon]